MNPPDPVSLFVSTLALIDYGCRFGYAHEEIGAFEDIVASATDLVSELKNKLREPVARHPYNSRLSFDDDNYRAA